MKKAGYPCGLNNGVSYPNFNLGDTAAAEGMSDVLADKRKVVLNTAITASVEDVDAVWDAGMADYLPSGGQASIDGRTAKWGAAFGE